ncbi:MAG: amidohydrolase family protein [Xanthobacteraceae bacterium]|jgi:predicted TIM-barrel fold metal-dependent hydrolase
MHGKIALEEHWVIDGAFDIASHFGTADWRLSVDSRDRRLTDMDTNGIELAILGLNSPALQAILDSAEAANVARKANDILADEIARNFRRFAGFAGLPMQNPEEASRELTRCVTELGFKGAMVNCFTQRQVPESAVYFDLPEFRPFWATVAKLDVPFYLHPRLTIPSRAKSYEGHSWLYSPAWDFGSETALQALRLIGSGLFDEFPNLQIVLGHLGERIPFDMRRIDNLMKILPVKHSAKKPVSHYMRNNFHVTTSGQFHDAPFHCALAEMGPARIMFSVDYPFEEMAAAATWFDNTTLSDTDRIQIGRTNAIKLFKLSLD